MFKIGLKLWSVNQNYVREAIRLFEQGYCQYIELLAVPDSFEKTIGFWQDLKTLKIPFIIHAPHFTLGLNFADRDNFEKNKKFATEALRFADELNAQIVIFHSGVNGDTQETIRQLKTINDRRIVIENKPYYGLKNRVLNKEYVCNGHSPEEIKIIMQETGVGFCFDIEHAVVAANALGIDQIKYIQSFLALKPTMYHITDGDWHGIFDQHKHLGQGNFKFDQVLGLYPVDCMISIESVHDYQDRLDDFEADVAHLRNIEKLVQEQFFIKPAQISDMRDVFELSNDAVVRRNSFISEQILWENHEQWFTQKIQDSKIIFYVIKTRAQDFIGYVRFDPEGDSHEYKITIHIIDAYRGKGFGKKIIEQATQQALNNGLARTVTAYIKEENVPSLKSFEKAGYICAGKTMKHDISCWVMKYRSVA